MRSTEVPREYDHALAGGARVASRERRPVLVRVAFAAPAIDPLTCFRRAATLGFDERAYWERPSEGFTLVGLGRAAAAEGHGSDRFALVSSALRDLLASSPVESRGSSDLPLALGGFAFSDTHSGSGAWRGYGQGALVVPELLYVRRGGEASLVATVRLEPDSPPERPRARLAAAMRSLFDAGDCPLPDPPVTRVEGAEDAPDLRWMAAVEQAASAVRGGDIEKLVLAREVRLRASAAINPAGALARLRAEYRDCAVFAFARGERCFLGATPEPLARLEGHGVRTSAVAGSIARGATPEEDETLGRALLADPKERREHGLVVEALRSALAPVCAQLDIPGQPELLRLANIQHLHTPVTGVVEGEGGLLDLVARLHPTPAVCGLPKEAALARIRESEPFDRGWYAGPIGWVDGQACGEFVVAIRSALIVGSEARLYAGCGIVGGSDPAREFEESRLKLRPLLRALGG